MSQVLGKWMQERQTCKASPSYTLSSSPPWTLQEAAAAVAATKTGWRDDSLTKKLVLHPEMPFAVVPVCNPSGASAGWEAKTGESPGISKASQPRALGTVSTNPFLLHKVDVSSYDDLVGKGACLPSLVT